jgi:hypothetical protein
MIYRYSTGTLSLDVKVIDFLSDRIARVQPIGNDMSTCMHANTEHLIPILPMYPILNTGEYVCPEYPKKAFKMVGKKFYIEMENNRFEPIERDVVFRVIRLLDKAGTIP